MIVLTHEHIDHTDPETLAHYLNEDSDVLVLASENAWKKVKAFAAPATVKWMKLLITTVLIKRWEGIRVS